MDRGAIGAIGAIVPLLGEGEECKLAGTLKNLIGNLKMGLWII
jgi:hypothetical protein